MQRTINIKLKSTQDDSKELLKLQNAYQEACNLLVPFVKENRCWNRFALHTLAYSQVRALSPLGSQMVCNAIFSVCSAYKNRLIEKGEEIPTIRFHKNKSVHFDKRTYTIHGDTLSLYTLSGRIKLQMDMGSFQQEYFAKGIPKEAELICKKGKWYFHLVLDLPDSIFTENQRLFGVDLGENVVAATSNGKLYGGGKIRYERDQFLAKRRRLQSNGSQSAKQLLKKISGKEARRMKQTNHEVSKAIVQDAIRVNAGVIVLENLTNIRKRIKAGKRVRTRLHRWSFHQLQAMIEYKAESLGLNVVYLNPAYSSQTCSLCDSLGTRQGSLFTCLCGNQQHSDTNASRTLCRFALSIGSATCAVNRTQVAARR